LSEHCDVIETQTKKQTRSLGMVIQVAQRSPRNKLLLLVRQTGVLYASSSLDGKKAGRLWN